MREWELGAAIAEGGFGRVFAARSDDGEDAAIKVIPKAPGAARELLFEDLRDIPNVLPIIETGETETEYLLAMPMAETSLRTVMKEGEPWPMADAVAVLRDVNCALAALEGRVVHRDIKPENILRFGGRWCLADFGIARYAEASTAPDTHKYAKTAAYAAPEQWRGERATSATDVYALGVLAYELLAGVRPFLGPDFREQHCAEVPADLAEVPSELASLVNECLFKAPGARPSPGNLFARLQRLTAPPSGASARLAEVNSRAVAEAASAMSEAESKKTESERRQSLFADGVKSFAGLREQLRRRVRDVASQAGDDFPFVLRGAELRLEGPEPAGPSELAAQGYDPAFQVVAYGQVVLLNPEGNSYRGRAHSMWFCDAQESGAFRWYELAWMKNPLIGERFELDPTALPPSRKTLVGLSATISGLQLAWPFVPVDQGESADFIERWIGWFADAAEGKLNRPARMPERDPANSYRSPTLQRGDSSAQLLTRRRSGPRRV